MTTYDYLAVLTSLAETPCSGIWRLCRPDDRDRCGGCTAAHWCDEIEAGRCDGAEGARAAIVEIATSECIGRGGWACACVSCRAHEALAGGGA